MNTLMAINKIELCCCTNAGREDGHEAINKLRRFVEQDLWFADEPFRNALLALIEPEERRLEAAYPFKHEAQCPRAHAE